MRVTYDLDFFTLQFTRLMHYGHMILKQFKKKLKEQNNIMLIKIKLEIEI